MSTTLLKQEFESAVNDYRWKDASDAAKEIISRTQDQAKTPSDEFNRLNESKQIYNDSYYLYHTASSDEFYSLMERHYESGFIAKIPVPIEIWYPNRELGPKMRNMLSYEYSEGDLLIPRDEEEWINDWFYIKLQELGDAVLYSQLLQNLPIETNIKTDLRENPLDVDPDTKICHTNFQLYLEGTDNPNVNYIITSPENFSITPTSFTQMLQENISLTIIQENQQQIMGLYYFELKITLNDKIIYSTFVPIRIKGYSHIDYVAYIPPEPISPGDIFNLLDVVNLGTIPESVVLLIEGVPENFIYKELYPDEFFDNVTYNNESIDNVQFFNTMPGDSRESFMINPPRNYTTAPGLYEFNVTAINPRDNSTHFIYQGSFEIVVYHELAFKCSNPDVLINDSDTDTAFYSFSVTNFGNMYEELFVTYDEVDFATSEINGDDLEIAPGETQSFSIVFDPFELSNGKQYFTVTVSNEFISREIICSLEVIDDDTNDPYFENIGITDDCNWVNIIFDGLDELLGDDVGLSLIEIYVDGELILSYTPTPSETDFSFSLINQWIWEITNEFYSDGQITHEIRVLIIDADDDRNGDYLTNEFKRYFEVTLDEMYNYVVWLLGEVNQYIYDNNLVALFGTVTQKLVRVQALLAEAYQLIEAGELHTGLVRDKIAEAKLEIAEAKAELKSLKGQVGEPYVSQILSMMHNVRNKIVELMGRSVGTEFGHNLSLAEVDLYTLRDLIEENIMQLKEKVYSTQLL